MLNLNKKLLEVEVAKDDKARRMKFDNPDPALHDVVLVVGDRKFYCSKIPLSKHSPFFYNLFFPDGEKSKQRKFEINATDFQETFHFFLETCYGINCISDKNVVGVLKLAKQWEAEIVIDRCFEWLVGHESNMSKREKFQLGLTLNWEKLMLHVLSGASTQDQLDSIVPYKLEDLDHHTMAMILEKSLTIGRIWPPRGPQPYRYQIPLPPPVVFRRNPIEVRRQVNQHLDQLEDGRDESNSEFSTDED